MLDKLISYLNAQLGKPKSYKTEFNLETAQKDTTLQEIARAYQALSEEADAKREALAIAGENEQARIEILQKEYEDRKNTANVINWVVTGLCIVGSVALTVATCGGAAPLTVALTAGAISAGGGVIMAGTQSITSQWVETGDLSKTNWLDVGKCSLLGGATGFVTGFVGAGAGGFITSGTISRFASGMINTGDVGESLRQAFDSKSMLFDAVLGGAVNSVQGINKPQQSFADLMSPEDAARYNAFLENGSNSGFTPQELKAFDKLDEALLMERIDYEEVLSARKSAIPNSNGTIGNVQGLKKPQQSFADMMSPEDAARYTRWNQLRENGLDINVENDILLTNKGLRPDPSTYLSPEYIQAHLAQFDDGVSVIQTEWAFSRYSETNGFVGVPDDNTLFVMPKEFCDEVLKKQMAIWLLLKVN